LVFLDSAFLIALIHAGDENRESALAWMQILEGAQIPLLTTEFCLLELVDFVSSYGQRALARELVTTLRAGMFVTIIPCSPTLLNRGLILHSQRDDKTWSLTDCMGMLVMGDYGVTEVMTYDHDFEQAGLRCVPLLTAV
jgi:predicted nucleic acid-binding protein